MRRIVARAADAHRLNQAFSETPFDNFKFEPITEHQVMLMKHNISNSLAQCTEIERPNLLI